MKKIVTMLLVCVMVLGLFAGCGNGSTQQTTAPAATTAAASGETEAQETEATPDTIVIMAPPVTGNYLENLKTWAADFQELYPNLTVQVIETSWGDHNDKLSTMAQAGEAPDIAEISSNALGTFVEMGVAIDIAQYMSADRLADYDENALKYLSLDGTTYGLPLYLTIQSIGANKTMMEELGIDVAKIQKEGWLDFDVVVATPDMMSVVGRLGKVLGPKGLMPNPKAGTVTMDVTKAIADIKAGKVEYRLDKANIIHVTLGKVSFTEEQLMQNFNALMGAIEKAKPSSVKGQYLKSISIATTMGPGVKIVANRY